MFGFKARKPARTRALWLESLESRVVLDGNVRAFVSGGVLRIEGDSRNNEILIEQSSLRSFRISSRDSSTTINGQAGPRTFSNVRDDLNVSLGSGNDVVEILGTADDAVTVSDRLVINTGSGADQVLLTEVHAIGLHINTGPGNDIINVGADGAEGGLEITKEAIIITDGGADEVSIANSLFKRFLVLNMGNQNDQTTLQDTRVRQRSTLIGGSGFDRLAREGNSGPFTVVGYERNQRSVDTPAPTAPVAVNDTASVLRGASTTINVAANDISAGSSLNLASIAITDQPDNGTVVVNTNGTVLYTANAGGTAAADTFQYTIRNQNGTISNPATVTVTIAAAFAAVADTASITEDASPNTVTGNILTNDTGGVGTRTVTAVDGQAANVGTLVNGSFGSFRINADGTFTYTLDNTNATVNNLNDGQTLTDTIAYTASAGGGASSTANLTITIQGTSDLTATPDTGAVTEDATTSTATGNVLTNDTGGTGTKTVTAVNGSAASVGVDVTRDHGTFRINADGSYTYTLNNNDPDLATLDAGETMTDTISYTVGAGSATSTATLTITITGVNEISAAPDSGAVTEDATTNTATGNVLANDTGGGPTKTVTAVNGAAGSVATDVQRAHGTFRINADGSFTYTLNNSDPDLATLDEGETLTDTIDYTVTSGGQTSTATLTITISGGNEISAAPDSGTVTEDTTPNTTTGNVLTNDTGGGPVKTVTAVNGSAGSVGANVQRLHGTFVIEADGDFTYTLDNDDPDLATLDNGETLTDTIDYTVSSGGQTSTATLTITIEGATDAG